MKRYVVCVDAGYLFAQGSVALSGTKQRRELLVLEPTNLISELRAVATAKVGSGPRLGVPPTGLLRIYWYDGALGFRPTLEQERLAHLDDVKLRLGFINSHGQQKGVDSLIVTDLIELARLGAICDAIVLSGDEDIRVGVQIAQNYGVRIHLLGIAPSRGSQSKALLQEADTTSEWDTQTVRKFLSLRSVPADATTTDATIVTAPLPGTETVVPSKKPFHAPDQAETLKRTIANFAGTLSEGDFKSLLLNWKTQRGLPPEFDGRLLAKSRDAIGRDLDSTEKRFCRNEFMEAVKLAALVK